jgi:protein gp37
MTSIAWTERTWNPIAGCNLVSPGCTHCYAMPIAHRLSRIYNTFEKYGGTTKMTKTGAVWTGQLNLSETDLDKPYHWKKSSLIFVNSMSDIAHESMRAIDFARIVTVMVRARAQHGHVFQLLTKRPENLVQLLKTSGVHAPLDGVWWGVSAEDPKRWDERVPFLLNGSIPNCLPWVSVEPQLRPLACSPQGLGWVVIGGESHPSRRKARPFELDWARLLIARCQAQGVPVFMKQVGSNAFDRGNPLPTRQPKGADPAEWPEDLRIRDWPASSRGSPEDQPREMYAADND